MAVAVKFVSGRIGFKSHSDHCLDMPWVIPKAKIKYRACLQFVLFTQQGFSSDLNKPVNYGFIITLFKSRLGV